VIFEKLQDNLDVGVVKAHEGEFYYLKCASRAKVSCDFKNSEHDFANHSSQLESMLRPVGYYYLSDFDRNCFHTVLRPMTSRTFQKPNTVAGPRNLYHDRVDSYKSVRYSTSWSQSCQRHLLFLGIQSYGTLALYGMPTTGPGKPVSNR
jgi:hypothetical protein